MKSKMINDLIETIDKNLPTILTGISVAVGAATTGYAIYTGYKTAKDLEELPEDAKTLDKVKKVAPKFVPVIIGVGASAGCAIAANHENAKRYAALAATVAATRLDMKKVQDKAEELLGKEKTEEIKKSINEDNDISKSYANIMSNQNKKMWFRDLETGYMFQTTLRDFMFAVKRFNSQIDNSGEGAICDFYSNLLKDDYMEASTHNDVLFGKHAEESHFDPDIDIELGPDMQPVYVVSYNYANTLLPKMDF